MRSDVHPLYTWLTFVVVLRGAYITAAIGIAICPWKLLTGTSVFLTVLSSFSVFIGPLTVRPFSFVSPLLSPRGVHTFVCTYAGHDDIRLSARAAEEAPFVASVYAQRRFDLLLHSWGQHPCRRFVGLRRLASHA